MTPKSLMILGAVVAIIAFSSGLLGTDTLALSFAAGAMFGKGYGVWEERGRDG